jgi:hypothetical protein
MFPDELEVEGFVESDVIDEAAGEANVDDDDDEPDDGEGEKPGGYIGESLGGGGLRVMSGTECRCNIVAAESGLGPRRVA